MPPPTLRTPRRPAVARASSEGGGSSAFTNGPPVRNVNDASARPPVTSRFCIDGEPCAITV